MTLYNEIPFLRSSVLTDVVKNVIPDNGQLLGTQLMPDRNVAARLTQWDSALGGRNIAPIVAPDAQSPLVKRAGAERREAEAVDVREKQTLREGDVLWLKSGDELLAGIGRANIADDLAKLKSDVETRFEKMRWDALLTGVITYNDTVDGQTMALSYNYNIPGTQFKNAGTMWDAGTSHDPRIEFKDAAKVIREASGATLTTAYMNSTTRGFIDNSAALQQDLRYTEGGDLVRRANITDVIANIRIVTYDLGYKLDVNWTGAFQYFLPENKVVFAVDQAAGGRLGDVAVAPTLTSDGRVVQGLASDQWTQPDPTRQYIRVVKIGIPRIFHRDWFVTYTVGS